MIIKTVKDLKEMIKDLPDDMLILLENYQDGKFHSPIYIGIKTMTKTNPNEYAINKTGKDCLIVPI